MSYRPNKRQFDDRYDRREGNMSQRRDDRFSRDTWNKDSHAQSDNNKHFNNESATENAGTMIFVQQKDLGKLIGRGGSQIRTLEEETNTKINVSNEDQLYITICQLDV